MKLFVPITKVDAKKRLVFGLAASEAIDSAGEVFDYQSSKPLFEAWSLKFEEATDGKSKGNLRSMHSAIAAGRIEDMSCDDARKTIEVCGKVVDDNEWNKVLEGVYTGFSIGGRYDKRWKDGDVTRYTAKPAEISLVDSPCNPEAMFTMVKMDGSEELRRLGKSNNERISSMITNDQVAARAKELAKAAGDETKWAGQVDAARAELEKTEVVDPVRADTAKTAADELAKAEKAAADALAKSKADERAEDDARVAAAAAAIAAPNAPEPDLEQVWKSKDGSTFKTKKEAQAHNETLVKAASDPAALLTAGLSDLSKSLDGLNHSDPLEEAAWDALHKKDYTDKQRKDMASSGEAQDDGSYPIKTKADLENAIKAYGRSSDKPKTKKHIIARAKSLGATDLLPADWDGSTKDKNSSKADGVDDLAKCFMYTKDAAGNRKLVYQKGAAPSGDGSKSSTDQGKPGGTTADDGSASKFVGGVILKKAAGKDELRKGLYFVCILARIIDDLNCLQQSAEWEAIAEEDNSPVPAQLKSDVEGLCATLMMVCNEETHELLGDADGAAAMGLPEMELAAADIPRGMSALHKLFGKAAPALDIIAKKKDLAHMDKVQAIHDHSCDLGAACDEDEADDGAAKAAGGDMSKALDAEKSRTAILEKAINDALPVISELRKRIVALEDQPKPRPTDGVRVVEKAEDGLMDKLDALAKSDPESVAQAIIQLSQRNPMKLSFANRS